MCQSFKFVSNTHWSGDHTVLLRLYWVIVHSNAIRQVVQKYLRIARRSNATCINVVKLGKKVHVECDVESLNVTFDMREIETTKSGIRRSKTLESTCRMQVYANE